MFADGLEDLATLHGARASLPDTLPAARAALALLTGLPDDADAEVMIDAASDLDRILAAPCS